ncbi:MAG: SUMF1/EgtB/PvdO family nonheme iron enzyme [Pseudomonadota bacterium]
MRPLIFIACLILSATAALANRVALVIGNGAYTEAPPLANPVRDASAISASLDRLGFDVIYGEDTSYFDLRRLVQDFSRRIEGADLALFYYAGHGIQVGGANYLLPVDSELSREADLEFAALDVDVIMTQMELAAATRIVILDACRNNPFETRLTRSMGTARSAALGSGLAPIQTAGGAFIAFATDPGEVAYDGAGEHSPFTEALLEHIETPNIEINTLMTRVRADVYETTGRLQRPWSTSSLLGEVYLAGAPVPEPEPEDAQLTDLSAWQAAEEAATPEAYAAYLEAYPNGLFREIAQARVATLQQAAAPEVQTAPEPEPETPDEQPAQQIAAATPPPRARPYEERSVPEATPSDRACPDCPQMMAISGGAFFLGSPGDTGKPEERPATFLTIPPFQLSQSEVTVGQFRAFVSATGHSASGGCFVWTAEGRMRRRSAASWEDPGYAASDEMPVSCVNWADANAYVDWLNTLDPSTKYRLASEAEFEFAARAGTETPFFWGASEDGACAAVNAADSGSRFRWRNQSCDDGYPDLAPVGAFPPNALGLDGMIGNLWEWTADCWNGSHAGAARDGSARLTGSCESRVLRGASWDDPVENLRSAHRVGIPSDRRQANVGFRVARDP